MPIRVLGAAWFMVSLSGCWLGAGIGGEQDLGDPVDTSVVDTDSEIDTDTGLDTETESETAEEEVPPCAEQPVSCEDIGGDSAAQEQGCCFEDQACFCTYSPYPIDDFGVICQDCGVYGGECFWNEDLERVDCTSDPWECDPPCIECDGEPLGCLDIGPTQDDQFIGCCWDNTLYWCSEETNWEFYVFDCAEDGLECGYDLGEEWIDCLP